MPPTTQAPPREKIDDGALKEELESHRGPESEEDDGLGPAGDPPTGPPADPPPAEDPPQDDPPAEDPPPAAAEKPDEISEEEWADPNSEYHTGVPGGRQPGDDGYVEWEDSPPSGEGGEPPTPPAQLPGEGEGGEEEEAEEDEPKLAIIGDRELGLKVGGRKPDMATLHLKGGKIELSGPKGSQFDRGDRFLTVSTLQVTADNDKDTIVKHTGEVTSTSKKQGATLCGIVRIEDWLLEKLADEPADFREMVFKALDLEMPEA